MNKMTYINAIDNALAYITVNDETLPTIARLAELRAMLEKRNSTESKAQREKKEQNSALRDQVLDALSHVTIPVTISELMSTDIDTFKDIKVQRISPIMKKLVEEGKVKRTEEKHKAYFELV